MPGSGQRGKSTCNWPATLRKPIGSAAPPGQVAEVADAALGVADPQAGQPAPGRSGSSNRCRNQSAVVTETSGMPPASASKTMRFGAHQRLHEPANPGEPCWRWRKIVSTSPRLIPRVEAIARSSAPGRMRAGRAGRAARSRSGSGGVGVCRRCAAQGSPRLGEARVEPVFPAPLVQQLQEPALEARRDHLGGSAPGRRPR